MVSRSARIDGIYTNLNMFRLRKLVSNRGLNMSAGHFFRSMCKYLSSSVGRSKGLIWTFYELVLILTLVIYPCAAHTWESPGCHRVGHTRPVHIPDCVVFNVTLNACRGFCESYAIPSPSRTLRVNNKHLITSRAECCSIRETHDVKVLVQCIDGLREVTFKSAKSCACSICRK